MSNENKVPSSDVQVDWNALLDAFKTESGKVLYLKPGRTKVRFLPFEDQNKIFLPVESYYKGKARTKYIAKVWHYDGARSSDDGEDTGLPIKAVLLTKKQIQAILTNIVEGYELFDPVLGHPLAFVKSGSGTQSNVNVIIGPKALAVPQEILEAAAEFDLAATGASWSAYQKNRTNDEAADTEEEAETPAPRSSKSNAKPGTKGKNSKRVTELSDDDEDGDF